MRESDRESVGGMEIEEIDYQTDAFFDKPPHELFVIFN